MSQYWYITIKDTYTGEEKYLRAPTRSELDKPLFTFFVTRYNFYKI